MANQGKHVLITGGGTGYGYGMAKVLKAQGAHVTITGRRKEPLERTAKELGVRAIPADVCVAKDWDRVFDALGGKLDVLINNAGAGVNVAPLVDQADDDIAQSIQINLTGAILGSKRAARIFTAQKSGLILNVSSVCAHYGWPGFSVYSGAKAGLDMFSRALYTELRPHGVRVTVLTPSWGSTEFGSALGKPETDLELDRKKMSPEQMGDLVAFICDYPPHLVFPEVMVQPVIQEIVPF